MVDLTNNARFMAVMLTVPTADFLFRQISVGEVSLETTKINTHMASIYLVRCSPKA